MYEYNRVKWIYSGNKFIFCLTFHNFPIIIVRKLIGDFGGDINDGFINIK